MIKGRVIYKPSLKYLRKVEKQSRFANAKALTQTAWQVKDEEVKALSTYLKSPTPFTKRAYRVKRATKAKPVAAVYAAPIQEKYLRHQVFSGTSKGQVPGKQQKLNAYGNLPRRATKRKRTFNATINGIRGTWQNVGKGKNRKLVLVAHFPTSRKYSKRLPFFRVARETVSRRFKGNYRKAFKQAMRTAR
jgi:hypothetical protein